MKKASEIVSHIINQPQFRYLKKHECFKRYISLLPAKWQNAVAFMYIKDNTMFIATNHPAFKMELNYNKDLLKSILSMLKERDEKCTQLANVNNVVIFNSKHNSIIKKKNIEDTVPYYDEMAFGEFIIESEDRELREAFEKIRESIENQI